VPFTTYTWGSGQNCAQQQQTVISSASRGQDRPVWALIHAHYAGRRGLVVPNVTAYMTRVRPEGGGGDYGSTSGGFDQLGFGTLTHTQVSAAIVSGGIYKLVSEQSGKALDNGNVSTEGTSAVQWTDNGGAQQRWRITDVGDGAHKLVSEQSGRALDNGNVSTEGASAVQWTDNGGVQQRWRITDVGDGAYKLVCQQSGKALDNGNVATEGASAVQWTDNGGAPQRWRLTKVG
jgi:hypothetical protein